MIRSNRTYLNSPSRHTTRRKGKTETKRAARSARGGAGLHEPLWHFGLEHGTDRHATAKIFARTHGGPGCGPNLQTVASRFITDCTFDCQAIRAREGLPGTPTEVNDWEGWDQPGMDYSSFGAISQQNCQAAYEKDHDNCRAWTWVKKGVQGPAAMCWLKNGIPSAKKDDWRVWGVVR